MTRFRDELVGSEGEWCHVKDSGYGRCIIVAVHDDGLKATVQCESDNSTHVVYFADIELEGEEV